MTLIISSVKGASCGVLADFYFTVPGVAGALVHVQDSAGRDWPCVDKPEGERNRAGAKQALTSPKNHRKLPEARRIDEIVASRV